MNETLAQDWGFLEGACDLGGACDTSATDTLDEMFKALAHGANG